METEIRKDIAWYEGLYQVSNLGDVFSIRTGKKLKAASNKGYMRVCLCKEGKQKNSIVHRLVATAFVENPESKPDVNHKDGNKRNNRADNLEWVTKSENTLHAFRVLNRTVLKGESHGMYGKKNPKAYFIKKYAKP